MARRKIPWEDIKREYVQGVERDGKRVYPSQRDLAERHGINASTVGRRAKAEEWAVQREIFASRMQAECKQKTIEALSDEGSQFNLTAFRISRDGLQRIEAVLGKKGVPMAPKSISNLANAARTFHQTGRLALGEPTETTEQRHRGGVILSVLTEEELRELEPIARKLEQATGQ